MKTIRNGKSGSLRVARRLAKKGRTLIRKEGEGEGNAAGGGANAGGESAGGGAAGANEQNNAGQEDRFASFWADPSEKGKSDGANGSDSASAKPDSGGSQPPLGKKLNEQIGGLDFGSVMTDKVLTDIADGKTDSFNTAINGMLRNAVSESMNVQMQVLEHFGTAIMGVIDKKLSESFGDRDNSSILEQEIPAARDPKHRPMIQKAFDQALKLNGGDRKAAVKQTKDFLATFTSDLAKDLDLGNPGADPHASSSPKLNWIEALAAK